MKEDNGKKNFIIIIEVFFNYRSILFYALLRLCTKHSFVPVGVWG